MKPKIKVKKVYGNWTVQFTIGVQTFTLEIGDKRTKKEALWHQRVLTEAFNKQFNMESKRMDIAAQTMLKLMEYNYYKQNEPGFKPGLLSNKSSICALAVQYTDQLILELNKEEK